jgi:hypothetical protein
VIREGAESLCRTTGDEGDSSATLARRAETGDEGRVKADAHKWDFKSRFRRQVFGWKSQPAIARVKQAVAEIKKVARRDPLLAAEGAVLFLERVSPALENVDSSSGAIGTAVNRAIADLVPIIADAPADTRTRAAWLERLWVAHANDEIPGGVCQVVEKW